MTIAPEWITALGTLILAVATFHATHSALKIANKDVAPRLAVNAVLRPASEGDDARWPVLVITLRNDSSRTLWVASVFWKIAGRRFEHRFAASGADTGNSTIQNIKLPQFDAHVVECNLNGLFRGIDRELASCDMGQLISSEIKIGARISTGQLFINKVSEQLATELRHRARHIHDVNANL